MSFQRITTIGSMPLANSEATASRLEPVALVLEPVDLDEVRARGRRRCAAPRSASRDLARQRLTRTSAICDRPAPSAPRPRSRPEPVGGLLGVVDDVVERGGERVAVGRGRSAGAGPRADRRWMMSWVIRSPSCSQSYELARELGALRVVARARRAGAGRALDVAPGLLEQIEHGRSSRAPAEQRHERDRRPRAAPASRRVHESFTGVSRSVTAASARRARVWRSMPAAHDGDVLRVGDLEIRPGEGLVLAGGRVVPMSVRELGAARRARAPRGARSSGREDLYAHGVGRARCATAIARSTSTSTSSASKLEEALPEWAFIHTHVGFGYRFSPDAELSHAFHNRATGA